ncbi:MAG: cytochrome P450, partial [Chlamydiia bacterium]|nr:cytochrome P450 [Chlamydiia bacterium]
ESYTREEMESMTRLMLVVGQRTSSVAFEGLLMFMALYPEWQEKLYEEIKSLPDPIDFDTLHSLPLLHSVIWEDLRLTPPVPLQTRELIQDVTYEGTTYKAGTMLAYIHRQAQRNPDLFPNPEEFDPGRFKMDGAMNKAEYGPQRFSPENPPLHTFSMPPHQCCGRVHALTAMKLAIVSILKEAWIEPADAEEMRQIFHIGGFVLRHSAPIRVRFIPR